MAIFVFLLAAALQAQSLNPIRYDIGSPVLQDIWVDPNNGNDANSGNTRALALRTLTAAWNRIPARQTLTTGYRIRMVAANYPESVVPGYWESRWGTAQTPVIVESADGPYLAVLPSLNIYDCRYFYLLGVRSVASGDDVVHCEKCDHFLIRNSQITGTGDIHSYQSPQETIKINQSRYVYIEDSDISGAYGNVIDMVAAQYGHMVYNRIHRAVDWCIYLKGGSAQFRVEGNEIYDCGTGGFSAGQGTGFEYMAAPWLQYEAYDIKFFNNVIHDTEGAGFGVNGGYNILLAHNTLARVGTRSHGLEFVFGGRSCDGNTTACAANRASGGWGPAAVGGEESIPNRNVYVYNNLLVNPPGTQSQWSHFAIYGPRTQAGAMAPNPARTDTNLQIRGNLIVNGPSTMDLGLGEDTGCASSNATCNATQLRADNAINTTAVTLSADYKPVASLNGARTFPIPVFPGSDQPGGVPAGNLDNSVPRDRDNRLRTGPSPGAFELTTLTANPISASPGAAQVVYAIGQTTGQLFRTLSLTAANAVSFTGSKPASTSWFTFTPVAGSAPGNIRVDFLPSGLAANTYQSTLTLALTGAQPLDIPVTMVVFTPGATSQVFTDVPASHPWVDPIFLLGRLGVTVGCSAVPMSYCPADTVTQAQMAAFIIRALQGENFSYPLTPYFSDMPASNSLFKYVQKMRELNINGGCGNGQFCPNTFVTRGQMAEYIVRALYGETYPYPTAQRFTDVSSNNALFPYVQKMWDLGVTQGCTNTTYCPSTNVNREQMAAFLTRAFFDYSRLTPAPAPVNQSPQIAGCNIFPADNVWNTPIDTLPVHSLSSTWVNTIGASRTFHADFGSGLWDGGPIGIPFVVVPQNQARINVTFEYDDESDPSPYPIPPNPPIEGGNASTGDRHILILEQGVCKLWELYAAYPQSNGSYAAGSGAIYNLTANGPLRPSGWTSADAAGLPILPGLVRYDETASGEIRHAIRFTVPATRREFIWPARHYASSRTGTEYPPMGARFRLKAGYNISGYSPMAQTILKAMKKYGILLADNGSAWYISGVPDERWNNDVLHEFHQLTGGAFEAVDASSLMIDVNSGQARQP